MRLLCMQWPPGVCHAEAQGENAGAPQLSLPAAVDASHEPRHSSTLDGLLHVMFDCSRGVGRPHGFTPRD